MRKANEMRTKRVESGMGCRERKGDRRGGGGDESELEAEECRKGMRTVVWDWEGGRERRGGINHT